MKVNIYDFDKTIVPFDSGTLFVLYCMVHYPWCILLLPIIGVAYVLMLLGIMGFTSFKRLCFMFVPFIPKEKAVKRFWDKHEKDVHPWFKDRDGYTVVISASPDFLLGDISQRLGFDTLICTKHSTRTGAIIGENCRGEEKVRRFYEIFDKDVEVVDVYSDSIKHDTPIFKLATRQCYHIVKGEMIPFDINEI